MPRKKKIEENNGAANESPKPAARRARSTSSTRKPSAKTAKPRKAKAAVALTSEPSDEEIRTRAYFIAERRHRFDLAGDADSDWLEAKRQLLSEAAPR